VDLAGDDDVVPASRCRSTAHSRCARASGTTGTACSPYVSSRPSKWSAPRRANRSAIASWRADRTFTANLRRDAIHKLTTALARAYATIVVEDLNVAGMVKNRTLVRAM
jgi:hypothetical protein